MDLAEVLGTAIALQLLFGISLLTGVAITTLDVMLILALQRFGFRKIEAVIATLLIVVAGSFAYELWLAKPRSEEHTSELQSLMRISYAVFCLKKKKNNSVNNNT